MLLAPCGESFLGTVDKETNGDPPIQFSSFETES
jgi:hypothetical protein